MPLRLAAAASWTPILILSSLLVAGPTPAAEPAGPRYSIKEPSPATGTNIRRDRVGNSALPFDKRYDQLTPEQQALVKGQYEALGPADEPPYPIDGLRAIYKAIGEAQQALLVSGNLTMAVEIDSRGEAASVEVWESPDDKMTRFVAHVLMQQKYKPARCNGEPCRMKFPFAMSFKRVL